jgi:hypothetical protein
VARIVAMEAAAPSSDARPSGPSGGRTRRSPTKGAARAARRVGDLAGHLVEAAQQAGACMEQ